jgi:hypothetical protein
VGVGKIGSRAIAIRATFPLRLFLILFRVHIARQSCVGLSQPRTGAEHSSDQWGSRAESPAESYRCLYFQLLTTVRFR